jgi:hypothetical protein
VGDEATEAPAMAGDQSVHGVDEHRCVKRPQQASERTGKPELGEERHASSGVAGHERAVAEDEPPTFTPRFLGYGSEKAVGLRIAERKEGHLLVSVERGDDPRRPAAELSAAGVEQYGTWVSAMGLHGVLTFRATRETLFTPYFSVAFRARSETNRYPVFSRTVSISKPAASTAAR